MSDPNIAAEEKIEAKVTHEVSTPHGDYTFTFYSSPKRHKQIAWNLTHGLINRIKLARFNSKQRKAAGS